MTPSKAVPFGSGSVDEVPLARAPLAKVIAQLRFPEIASITNPTFVGPFQEALRSAYPNAAPETSIELTADAPTRTIQLPYVNLWRFHDVRNEWTVTLTPAFLALETTAYVRREDFLMRWRQATDAFARTIRTDLYTRLGVRYVNRVDREGDVADLGVLCRRALLPLSDLASDGVKQTQSFAQSEFEIEGDVLRVRSAVLPPNHLIDVGTIAPVDRRSWVLDLDMFGMYEPPRAFTSDGVAAASLKYAETIYRFFRWAVTDEFMKRMGARHGT